MNKYEITIYDSHKNTFEVRVINQETKEFVSAYKERKRDNDEWTGWIVQYHVHPFHKTEHTVEQVKDHIEMMGLLLKELEE